MKAQDLRIGNLVEIKDLKHAPKTWQVEGVGNLVQLGGQLWSIEELKPIPLTEEWLERFGFEQKDKSEDWVDNVGYMELGLNGDGYVMLERSYYHASQILLYVHQLQNLYYAISGEELTVKEPA